MYTTIDIDFAVHKAITARRESSRVTPNDVLREMFGLGPDESGSDDPGVSGGDSRGAVRGNGRPWVWKGVSFPHGTDFRADYKGQMHPAKVDDGALVYNGERFKSPSSAASAITGNSLNGWDFWECRLPGSEKWVPISELRR